jgi:hypothetical protein
MPALIREKQPFKTVIHHFFIHPDKLIGERGKILRVLITPYVYCFFSRQVMPLLACNLASSAGGTNSGIYKN